MAGRKSPREEAIAQPEREPKRCHVVHAGFRSVESIARFIVETAAPDSENSLIVANSTITHSSEKRVVFRVEDNAVIDALEERKRGRSFAFAAISHEGSVLAGTRELELLEYAFIMKTRRG
jgi:hypothetical protein